MRQTALGPLLALVFATGACWPVDPPAGGVLPLVLLAAALTAAGWGAHATRRAAPASRSRPDLESEERELSDFFENACVAMRWVGPDGTILRANQAELDLLGYARDEYVGRNIADFHVDAPALQDILARLRRGDTVRDRPARMRRKDGSIRDVRISSTPRLDGGRLAHTRCITLDVTDRKRADDARSLLAAIVDASGDAIVSKTLDGVILSWNAGAQRLFGYTAAEAVGRPITLIIPPELHHEERSILERLCRGERIEHYETVRVARDGRRVDVSLSVAPVRDDAGRTVAASIARDITDRKKAADALRRSERRFRLMADAAPVMIWISGPDRLFTWFNKRWLEFVGRPIDRETGTGWIENVHPEDRDRCLATHAAAFDAGRPFTVEYRLRRHDGEYRWLLDHGVPFDGAEGELGGYIGSCVDITHHARSEQELREADRRKTEFLATLAHELRTPLAPIRSSLEILKRAEGEAESHGQARETIERQLVHLVRLVDDLLDVSRITHGRLELRREEVELASVIHHALETCRAAADGKAQTIEVALPPRPVYVHADPVRLAQVFANLLSNACKYTPRGGTIRIGADAAGDEAFVTVADDGMGIPAERLGRVFEMFEQGEPGEGSDERPPAGLGIGLTLVKRLVELHGGDVEARSAGRGMGSEFVVRLPVLAGASAHAPSPSSTAAKAPPGPLRVLVVDDNEDSAESLARLLRHGGHQTWKAYDGLASVDAAERHRPDVILLDIGLPKLSGLDACRRIRSQPWGREITMIALTGWAQEEDRDRSRHAGFDGHLVKPVDHETLMGVLASRPAR